MGAQNSLSASTNRVDVLIAVESSYDLWLSIQFASGKAAGLLDKLHLDFENGCMSFPHDCADSRAGSEYNDMESKELKV